MKSEKPGSKTARVFAFSGLQVLKVSGGREPDSDFEIHVAEQLADAGFDVVAQVGVAGYFLDLAVRHPKDRTRFLKVIEDLSSTAQKWEIATGIEVEDFAKAFRGARNAK